MIPRFKLISTSPLKNKDCIDFKPFFWATFLGSDGCSLINKCQTYESDCMKSVFYNNTFKCTGVIEEGFFDNEE